MNEVRNHQGDKKGRIANVRVAGTVFASPDSHNGVFDATILRKSQFYVQDNVLVTHRCQEKDERYREQ